MDDKKTLNHNLATFAWGALIIWMGIAFLIDPLTIGMWAMGTGVILLGLNAVRARKGIPTRGSTTVTGIIALTWGAFDQGRRMLGLPFSLSLASLLVIIGIVIVVTPLLPQAKGSQSDL